MSLLTWLGILITGGVLAISLTDGQRWLRGWAITGAFMLLVGGACDADLPIYLALKVVWLAFTVGYRPRDNLPRVK